MPKDKTPEERFGGSTMIGNHMEGGSRDYGHLLRSEQKLNQDLRAIEATASGDAPQIMPEDKQRRMLKFLRDAINGGKKLSVPTFVDPTPADAIKIEVNALTIKYEKKHGKGSVAKDFKKKELELSASSGRGR